MKYWAKNGYHQTEYDKLYGELVPSDGACETLEGEFLRAISKIYYDLCNNGFGNDWRKPLEFLKHHTMISEKCFSKLDEYADGDQYVDTDTEMIAIGEMLDAEVDAMIVDIGNNRTPNTVDMWAFGAGYQKMIEAQK
ncbi:hypothetical protein OAV22_02065 [Flavobacteriaceae bacterium]|nr:hypothetical protein [Flavobacteriaceae bacterium]